MIVRFLLVVFLFFLYSALEAGERDTTFIRRPYYLGIGMGYTQFLHVSQNNGFVAPVTLQDLYYSRQFNLGFAPAIQFSFPFLRRMECEMDLQRTTWFGVRSEVSEYHYGGTFGYDIVGFRTTRRWFDKSVWQLRSCFSYELKRKKSFALLIGAGGWLDLKDINIRGNYGIESQLKCYIQPPHFSTLEFAVVIGGNSMDAFVAFRLALLLKGSRTYRVKPYKYYTRTYEDE